MRILMVLLIFIILGAGACSQSGPEQIEPAQTHPLLEGLEQPPLNEPLVAPEPIKLDKTSLRLPEDELPALLVLLGENPFSGTFLESGRINIGSDIIEFQTSSGESLRILYRLPQEMRPLPEGTIEGRIDIREFSGPQGANRSVMVSDKQAILFSEVWQNSEKPLTIELGDELRLSQEKAEPLDKGGYTEAKLGAFEGEKLIITIPIGKPIIVESSEGTFQVFAEVSHLFSSRESDLDQYPDSYILHVWIVKLK